MGGQRKALIVANDEYEHEALRRLKAPSADARALARVLGDRDIGGFNVDAALNQPAHDVEAQIEDLFADSQPDDILLLHFSCHGLKSEAGELFFAARNTRPDRLGSTAIAADFIQRCIKSCRARSIVLFLDCCYGGAFGQGVSVRASGSANVLESFPSGKLGGGKGRAVITASSSMEYAFEGNELAEDHQQPPSLFTAALVQGLETGEADHDEDGLVSLNELYDYVFDKVREQNPNQTPGRDVEMQGELYLARSQRKKVRPLPIPAEVQAALRDPNMFTRLGAVGELRARLCGEDIAAALGAQGALADLSRTDIKYVGDAAAEALGGAALRVTESELGFGEVERGATASLVLHLSGPPIARACTFSTSDRWISIEEAGDGPQVSVDTTAAGRLRGSITVKGPTGEAVVPVSVDVIPADVDDARAITADPEPLAMDPAPARPPAAVTPAVVGLDDSGPGSRADGPPLSGWVVAGRLTAFDIDEGGDLSNRRVWADFGTDVPDGICLDAEGAIWYADVPNRHCVRVREGGEVLQVIAVDRGCSSCALGGPMAGRCSSWRPSGTGLSTCFTASPRGRCSPSTSPPRTRATPRQCRTPIDVAQACNGAMTPSRNR